MSKYHLKKYDVGDAKIWDDLVEKSVNGTIFHTQKFISYHPADRFEDSSLMFFKGEKVYALFPAAIISDSASKKILKSHPGTSYGGIVFAESPSLELCFQTFGMLEEFAKSENISSIEFRHAPKIFNKYPTDQAEFAMGHLGYIREAEELSTCHYLPDFAGKNDDEIISGFTRNTRRNLEDAQCYGLDLRTLDSDEHLYLFHKILTNNLKKHNANPVHSLDEIKKLLHLFPEKIKVEGTFLGEELLSTSLLFQVNEHSWHIFYASIDYNKPKYNPLHYHIFELLKRLSNKGFTWLNYGISTENGGKIINHNLFRFKEGFSGHGIMRTYWTKEL